MKVGKPLNFQIQSGNPAGASLEGGEGKKILMGLEPGAVQLHWHRPSCIPGPALAAHNPIPADLVKVTTSVSGNKAVWAVGVDIRVEMAILVTKNVFRFVTPSTEKEDDFLF